MSEPILTPAGKLRLRWLFVRVLLDVTALVAIFLFVFTFGVPFLNGPDEAPKPVASNDDVPAWPGFEPAGERPWEAYRQGQVTVDHERAHAKAEAVLRKEDKLK